MNDVIILGGAGGMSALYYHLKEVFPDIKVAVLDERAAEDRVTVCGDVLPIITDWDFGPAREFFGLNDDAFQRYLPTFTYPKVKKILVEKARERALEPVPTFVHPSAVIIGDVEMGMGGFIGMGCYVASETRIGDYVTMGNAVLSHDVVVGDYCTIGTNTSVLGYVTLGEGVQVSPGAVVKTGVTVASWVVIGIQAAVVSDVATEGVTVGGVPAKELNIKRDGA